MSKNISVTNKILSVIKGTILQANSFKDESMRNLSSSLHLNQLFVANFDYRILKTLNI